jgi:hypothetical protein
MKTRQDEEQNLILSSFQNFLNTLDFSTQFFIHSRKVNIGHYLDHMKTRQDEEQNQLLKIQIEEYISFIRQFVEENQIVNKTFFVIVPHHKTKIASPAEGVLGLFGGKRNVEEEGTSEEETIQQVSQRVDQVVSGLQQIGLQAIPLEDEELIELFYNLYNPQLVEKKDTNVAKLKE